MISHLTRGCSCTHRPGLSCDTTCPVHAPAIGATRACPGCGRPQHYTGIELGWCHDAAIDTLTCGASPALLAELEK